MKGRQLVWLAGCIGLSGCTTITNWANDLGSHMPVIGERCEHWQCITDSGQMQSDYKKQYNQQPSQQPQEEQQDLQQHQPAPDSQYQYYDYQTQGGY